MSDTAGQQPSQPEVGEVIAGAPAGAPEAQSAQTIDEPAKIMRIGGMVRQLLEEVRSSDLDEESRDRLRDIYETSVAELGNALSPDLREELERLATPFDSDEIPSEAVLQIAQAQLVGWLEGLFQGIQATLFVQQAAARAQLENMRGQLPGGAPGGPQGQPMQPGQPGQGGGSADARPGTYI